MSTINDLPNILTRPFSDKTKCRVDDESREDARSAVDEGNEECISVHVVRELVVRRQRVYTSET